MTLTQIRSDDNLSSMLRDLTNLILQQAHYLIDDDEDAVYQHVLEYLYEHERSTLAMILSEFEKGKSYVGPVIIFGAAEVVFDGSGTEVTRRPLLPLAEMNIGRNNQHTVQLSFKQVVKSVLGGIHGGILDRAFAEREAPIIR